ncbi:MAG: multicomponent Na+:H+ antiporter subunit E [Verrucomicrobiales bacterium]|jgi:multicomponent Na+:H+ antiporter subunit E
MHRLLIFSLLLLTWLVLSGLFDVFHITLGVLCAGIVTWMSSDLLFQERSTSMRDRFLEMGRVPSYFVWLLWQIVLANVYILKLALTPGGMEDVSPRVVRFKTRLKSDFAKYVLAQSITLTPGTVTIKIVGDEFFVHAISKEAADGLDGAMEEWIAHIYEPELEKV